MIGIIAAMPEEITQIEANVKLTEKRTIGNREFHLGTLFGHQVVVALARIGKVAAASTTTTLINCFDVRAVILTGVAGGIHPDVKIGDVVIGNSFIQHDMDASASGRFTKFEIPLLGVTRINACEDLVKDAANSAKVLLEKTFPQNKVHVGLMGAGDQFIASKEKVTQLRQEIPDLLCVEMEGAAAAQVCHEYGKPFVSIRSISDNANDEAGVDFLQFVDEHAAPVSRAVVEALLQHMAG
jgi:adenosylhomocysteine nucleosidase